MFRIKHIFDLLTFEEFEETKRAEMFVWQRINSNEIKKEMARGKRHKIILTRQHLRIVLIYKAYPTT